MNCTELLERDHPLVRGHLELIRAGMIEVVIVDGRKQIRSCNPQFLNCTWCPWVSITDYEEFDEDDPLYWGPGAGTVYSLPKAGFCNLTCDVLLNFEKLPDCRFLQREKERRADRLQRRKEWKEKYKIERWNNLVEETNEQMDILTNPENFKSKKYEVC